ncbi:hypothetical protein FRX31_018678 [Thalictrum thalictroides]|uniref:ZZ-type domain-containing protein n=1 Tax=Thalictrum thalictroides TaxID=46969 RepID=A0A7J6W5W5_THATH|nr:hypothetical protein FRX31_018678 [Thalictrum thalictroides]
MYAIVGMRYRCKDCWEKCIVIITERGIGFDLCEECYNTPSKHSDLVNHHHTQGHTFELIANSGYGSVPVNFSKH